MKDVKKKVYFILDNLRVHHSEKVTQWLEAHKGKIAVFYLPAYAPELNPDEYLNNNLKQRVHSGIQTSDAFSKKCFFHSAIWLGCTWKHSDSSTHV